MKGPFTQGIFRKSANARLVRELRERLDSGQELAIEHIPVLAVAALLKEFLRSLPDPLLGAALYPLYMEALECRDEQEKLIRVKRCVSSYKALQPVQDSGLVNHFLPTILCYFLPIAYVYALYIFQNVIFPTCFRFFQLVF